MRLTIIPKDAPTQGITLKDGSRLSNLVSDKRNQASTAVLDLNGLSGWYDSLEPDTTLYKIPGRSGSYMPVALSASSRIVTIRGHHVRDRWSNRSSSVADGTFRDLLNSLALREVELTVYDELGVRRADGYVSSSIETSLDMAFLTFTIIITCPDPYKYGDYVYYPVSNGRVEVENNGNVESLPVIQAHNDGGVRFVNISDSSGHEVSWEGDGSAPDVTLDFSTLNPTVGLVTEDDAFAIPTGISTIYATATAGSIIDVMVRPAWR